ncbi:alpha/beta hydrolase [Tomitella cavernea]|uniref:Alpha/beta-hydrolase family protein n=1 Tax=Tomitella cavernea TaxID=1387982 RepID=A0ABP9CXB7_9ACTN|nr:alpha/beta-hydrolase family protein [Tomitella cavernea]
MTTEQIAPPKGTDQGRPRSRARVPFRGAPYLGLVGALLFFWASLTPTLLPRGPLFQGAVSGGSAAIGYGIGILVALFLRWLLEWEPPRMIQRIAWWVLPVAAAGGTVAMLVWFAHWQSQLRTIMSADGLRWWAYPLTLAIAVLVWAAIIAVCRGFRWLARLLTRLGRGFLPRRVAAVAGVVLAGWLVVTLANGVLANWLMSGLNSSFSAINDETEADSAPPDTPLRSGSAESLVTWDSLGRLGRRFVSDGPTVEQIERFTGRSAVEPIRVYAGLASTDGGVVERAQRVVDELERTGALDRQVIAVANTTGSGWINEASSTSLEYMFGGDTAIASMQYSYLPSWLSFIADQSRARQAGRALFRAVAAEVQTLPADRRPRLVTFGESLGSFSGESAFSGDLDLAAQTDGALFVGPTSNNELWRRFTAQRDEGSPEWLPIYREGMTVRFISDAEDLQRPDTPWEGTRVVYLQHASDPITWWNPDTLLSEPDWLDEPRGDAVLSSTQWYPIITFLQLSADMAVGTDVPDGFGHTYVADYADAWAAILEPPQWTDDDTRRLRKVLAE